MGRTFGLRTAEHAARALGVTDAEVAILVERGELRALTVVGGGWVTTDADLAAVLRRRQGRIASRRRPRPRDVKRAVASPSPPGAQRPASAASPGSATPVTPPTPASVPPRRRSVPIDVRPDVEPNQRLDMRAAAVRLGVDYPEAVQLAERGRLQATRLGRQWITTTRDVDAYRARAMHGGGARTAGIEAA